MPEPMSSSTARIEAAFLEALSGLDGAITALGRGRIGHAQVSAQSSRQSGPWTPASPSARWGFTFRSAAEGYVYVTGGYDALSGFTDQAHYARISGRSLSGLG